MLLVKCANPSCGAQLFVSKGRQPVCGKCNHPVAADTMKKAVAQASQRPSIFTRLRSVFFKRSQGPVDPKLISPLSKELLIRSEFTPLRKKVDGRTFPHLGQLPEEEGDER